MVSPAQQRARADLALKMCDDAGIVTWSPDACVSYALRKYKNPCVCFSGGKASLAVLHMVKRCKGDVPVVFNDTGVEHPATVEYVKQIADLWHLDLIITKPDMTFWEIVDRYGFPGIRASKKEKADPSRGKKNRQHPKCCDILKRDPMVKIIRKYGFDLAFLGIQACESRNRFLWIAQRGQFSYNKHWGITKCYPIAFWTDQDLMDYIKRYNLPLNPVYKMGFDRTGCLPCTANLKWREQLARANPKLLNYILQKKGTPGLLKWLELKGSGPRDGEPKCTSYA
jgi:3'-phosphoadenosine 5'-phosphosulfate sulfotransferase (PAPS reductase)/FAD synthetase